MVSWMYAFKRGFIIFLWAILWSIIGGVVAAVISGGSMFALISNLQNPEALTTTEAAGSVLAALIGMVVGFIIGELIAIIGIFATIVKIVLESVEETKRPPPPQPSV